MTTCGRCHTCGRPITIILDEEEYCAFDQQYQRPLAHGWKNDQPSEVEQRPCPSSEGDHVEKATAASDSDVDQPEELPIIHRYSRKDAIDDGMLVDIAETTRQEFGIRFALALTAAVWNEYVVVPEGLIGIQDEQGRLADILTMLHHAARRSHDDRLVFSVLVKNSADETPAQPVQLKAVVDGGDDGLGAITIMLPHED